MDTCAICLDTLDDNVYSTVCNHAFHKSCLATWLGKKATCPMCRAPCVIDPLPRYRVWSPHDKHKWCTVLERILSWYISFENDDIILSSRKGTRLSIDVRKVKEASISGQTVEVLYIADSYHATHDCETLILHSADPAQLVGAIGCFFYTCNDRQERARIMYSSTSFAE